MSVARAGVNGTTRQEDTKVAIPAETAAAPAAKAPAAAAAPAPAKAAPAPHHKTATFLDAVFEDAEQDDIPTPKALLGLTFGNKNKYEELALEPIDTDSLLTSNHAGANLALLEQRAFDFELIMNRLWAELFGLIRIFVVIAFTLVFQAVRFTTWGIKRFALLPTLVFGTETFGPSLWIAYEGYAYPALVVALSLVKAGCVFLRVTGDALLAFVAPVIGIVKAFRLVDVVQNYHVKAPEAMV